MPLQIYTPFRAADYVAQGGQQFGAGIGAGLASAGAAFGDRIAERKDRADMFARQDFMHQRERMEKEADEKKAQASKGKAAETFYKATADMQRTIPQEDWALLSPIEKAAAMEGFIQSKGAAANQTAADFHAMQLSKAKADMENAGRFGAFAADMADQADLGPIGLREFMDSAAATGYRPDMSNMDDFLRAATVGNRAVDLNAVRPQEGKTESGIRYLWGKDGQFRIINEGLGADAADAQPVADEDGNLLGHNIPQGNGRWKFRPLAPPATGELQPAVDPATKKPIPGWFIDAHGKAVDMRDARQKLGVGTTNAPAAAPQQKSLFDKFKEWQKK